MCRTSSFMGIPALSAGADSSSLCQWLCTSNWHSACVRDAGRFTLQCQDLCGRRRKKTKQRQKAHNGEQTQKHEKCEDHLLTVGCVSTHYLKIPAQFYSQWSAEVKLQPDRTSEVQRQDTCCPGLSEEDRRRWEKRWGRKDEIGENWAYVHCTTPDINLRQDRGSLGRRCQKQHQIRHVQSFSKFTKANGFLSRSRWRKAISQSLRAISRSAGERHTQAAVEENGSISGERGRDAAFKSCQNDRL